MKYLIVGLGNIGSEYHNTRHNIGFMILDAFAEASNIHFNTQRYGDVVTTRVKNKTLVLLKPSTYMNLSGDAVRYWMQKENIGIENVLVLVDDIAIPFGAIRIKGKGSDAGHNGLKHIAQTLGSEAYARLRFGIGNDYPKGAQVNYVLSTFEDEERKVLPERIDIAIDAIKAFALSGLSFAMNHYNRGVLKTDP